MNQRKTGIIHGREIPTIWIDTKTGHGVTHHGAPVTPIIGARRKNPNLTDMLDTAASYGADRIMLCGERPEVPEGTRHWLAVQTPGWKSNGHWLEHPPVGRFEHERTGAKVQVHLASVWFPKVSDPDSEDDTALPLKPAQAREAWQITEQVVQTIVPEQRLLYTPSNTGMSLWWQTLPRTSARQLMIPQQIEDADIAEDLHRTSGQHHIEHLVGSIDDDSRHPDVLPMIDHKQQPKIGLFSYVDGRFMYASLGRELGVGPGVRFNRAQTHELLNSDPYARAWVEVKFTVPEGWNHVGLLGVQHENVRDGWFYPNRPGATYTTWADSSEVFTAMHFGWIIDPQQSIVFAKRNEYGKAARPLDNFMNAIDRVRTATEQNESYPPMLRRAVTAALRQILIHTVGKFSARGTMKSEVTTTEWDAPDNAVRHGKILTYQVPGDKHQPQNYYPQFSVQIWGRGRNRVLDAPTALGPHTGGALTLPPQSLIGINGDAIYSTVVPQWAKDAVHAGGDDGKTGRLRLKGVVPGPGATPKTLLERERLRAKAEQLGLKHAYLEEA